MTTVTNVRCDQCDTIGAVGASGWIVIENMKILGEEFTDTHFCSIHCFMQWLSNAQKFRETILAVDLSK